MTLKGNQLFTQQKYARILSFFILFHSCIISPEMNIAWLLKYFITLMDYFVY